MAADYWVSSQSNQWLFSREQLASARQKLAIDEANLVQQYPLPEWRVMNLYFSQPGSELARLGKRMSVRQQALATAQVYVQRFYSKVEIRRTNPYLVLATTFYLACKMEECPQHIRHVVHESRQMWSSSLFGSTDVAKLGECEFFLISEMNSQMIIHHPYRTLQQLHKTLDIGQDDFSLAWSIVNDHYLTDLPLLYPPHIIAITSILLALTLKPNTIGPHVHSSVGGHTLISSVDARLNNVEGPAKSIASAQQAKIDRFSTWLAEGRVEIEAVVECSQEIISLYAALDQVNDSICEKQISRYIKARGLDK